MGNCFETEIDENRPPKKREEKPEREDKEVKPSAERKDDTSAFATDLMKAQNAYRMKHGAEPLELDQDMCKEAQRWADRLANSSKLEHAEVDDGENLAFAGPTLNAQQAADMWYNEIKDYDFRNPGFTGGTGHFTQIVWVGSKQFGAGVATGSNGMYAVGRYRPAGNITNAGQFEANVLPGK